LITLLALTLPVAGTNFTECLANIRSEAWRTKNNITEGETDGQGNPIPFSPNNDTKAVTYGLCKQACTKDPQPPEWGVFSKQFSAWLLPWLALVSQLPFGTEDKLDDLIAMALAVGSPTLAAFSLAMTILNGHWAARRLRSPRCEHENTENALHVLNSLQQYPLHVNCDGLATLVVHETWWKTHGGRLAGSGVWSISAAASLAWVCIAYIFTVIDLFTEPDVTGTINATGAAIGSIWLWLLPVVVGWLQNLTKNDLQRDVDSVNEHIFAVPPGSAEKPPVPPISLRPDLDDVFARELSRTAAIYNYARSFLWIQSVEMIAMAFEFAQRDSENAEVIRRDRIDLHFDAFLGLEIRPSFDAEVRRVGGGSPRGLVVFARPVVI